MKKFGFTIEKKVGGDSLARAGIIHTPHGDIKTPAFIVVGTKATVKSLTMEQVKSLGTQIVLANTYHLYLAPGDELVKKAGGLAKFMNWQKDGKGLPTFTDSGGFQVFSLGVAYGKGIGKVAKEEQEGSDPSKNANVWSDDVAHVAAAEHAEDTEGDHGQLATIDDEGVTFKSHRDGSTHRFTPERSIQIQHNIGADIIVAFDECTSPHAPHDKQKRSLDRTHEWAKRSLAEHKRLGGDQALYGVIQGGKHQDLREEAARTIGAMDFDGFGIGGSFSKDDIGTAVRWVNTILPEDKPRHLLGIGEPIDFFYGIEAGVDTFDCVSPTRLGRNGSLYTKHGRMHITNAKYTEDHTPIDDGCACYTCTHHTRAYLAHLFREDEMLGAALGSIHNLYFAINLVERIRLSLFDGTYAALKEETLGNYYKKL
jgi:queuine tRNA-ribosyltransferase